MDIFELIDVALGFVQLAAVAFLSYRFYTIYRQTRERVSAVLSIVFLILAIGFVPHIVVHQFLGLGMQYSEPALEIFFLLTVSTLAWAIFPRPGWKGRLRTPEEGKGNNRP